MKELTIRTISGIFFVFIVISAILAHEISFLILFLVILLFSLNEFYNLLYKLKFHPYKPYGIIIAGILFIVNYYIASGSLAKEFLLLNILIILLLPVLPLFYNPKTFSQSWISTLGGWIYILLPFSLIPFIVFKNGLYQPLLLIGVFAIIWANDSLAYLFGTWLGKHKMFPSISPKKSWEGFFGGLLLTIAASYFLSFLPLDISPFQWIQIALITIITGNIGDFLESAIKRNAGVKDSGRMMPGHGGFLDRFDSFIFSISFVFLYFSVFIK